MTRIHHANIRVADPQASLDFYRALGLDVVGCMRMEGLYTLYLGTPEGDAILEFSVNESKDPSWMIQTGSGHLALAVDDLDSEIARLATLGIEPEAPAYHPGGRPDVWVAFFRDPDGNRVELLNGTFPPPQDELPGGLT
ncbi:VOC family protein [Streptomyces sp. NPDC047043]|uniref:VOC family protein n=1 Tax=Streptomyces sp. NPDC047043 TaxID=3154497 RepID=UPI0033C34F04